VKDCGKGEGKRGKGVVKRVRVKVIGTEIGGKKD